MHNRDMIWTTREGKSAKIRNMSSDHLVNVIKYIDINIDTYESRCGKKKIKETKHNIKQEIRLRKLNRIELNSNEENLF
jgi:hypothetical protein